MPRRIFITGRKVTISSNVSGILTMFMGNAPFLLLAKEKFILIDIFCSDKCIFQKNKQNIEDQKILLETYHGRTLWSETGSNPSKFLCIKLRYRVESSTELGWLRIYTTICIWTKCRSKSPWKLNSVNPISFRRCKANSHVIARNFRFFSHLNRCHVKARGKTYRILEWFYLSAR